MNRHTSAVGYDTVKIRVNFIIAKNASTSWIGLSRPEFTLFVVFRRMDLAMKKLLSVGLSWDPLDAQQACHRKETQSSFSRT